MVNTVEHTGVAVQLVVGDLATGEEAHQRHVAQRVAHDLQLGAGRAEVRPAAPGAADVDRAGDARAPGWASRRCPTAVRPGSCALRLISSGSSSSRTSAHTRMRSARAACTWRSQKARRVPSGTALGQRQCHGAPGPARSGGAPPPRRRTALTRGAGRRPAAVDRHRRWARVRPTSGLRRRSMASCGRSARCSSASSSTSSAGSPSSGNTRLPSALGDRVRSRSTGCAPCVTRDTMPTSGAKRHTAQPAAGTRRWPPPGRRSVPGAADRELHTAPCGCWPGHRTRSPMWCARRPR